MSAFDLYLFGSDLLAFVALKVLSNNHLHLLAIRFAFVVVQLSSFGLAVFGFVVCQTSRFLFPRILIS